jgi:hypothetical protein
MDAGRAPTQPDHHHGIGHRLRAGWAWASAPLVRLWDSHHPLDAYALVHMASAAGDALVALALADSIFFALKPGAARTHVALYLGLTMAPLAVAGPVLVPLLDRGGYRRVISFIAAAARAGIAIYAAPRFGTLVLFPAAFGLLVMSKINTITRNGLTVAYAPSREGLMAANARLGRLGVIGGLIVLGPGIAFLKLGGAQAVLYLAACVFGLAALLNLRLPQPPTQPRETKDEVRRRGRMPSLAAPAVGTAGLRGAMGFLIVLLAFALRRSGEPTYWFGLLAISATAGGFIADLLAPRISRRLREEAAVIGSLLAAGAASVIAFVAFGLPILMVFAAMAGAAAEFAKLAFQSLMQREAPGGAQGRVFVRYEVVFQLAWVLGAFIPAVVPIDFRAGVLILAVFYLALGLWYVLRPAVQRGRTPAA